jgi:mannan endo-1,4-beta-mannosidase
MLLVNFLNFAVTKSSFILRVLTILGLLAVITAIAAGCGGSEENTANTASEMEESTIAETNNGTPSTEETGNEIPSTEQSDSDPDDVVANELTGYTVAGRYLLDSAGEQVVLRGVNKMAVYTDHDGSESFAEIAATGANSVRIVWAIADDGFVPDATDLEVVIGNAIVHELIPMIELHDATGNWSKLADLVNYWTRQDIASAVKKHEKHVLVNIGNEVGDDSVTAAQFIEGYTSAVLAMRAAGYRSPLVIDAPDWGKNLTILNETAQTLLQADPDHNLIFSVHLYWPKAYGADAAYIRSNIQAAVQADYLLVIGEFSRFGAYAGEDSICSIRGETDYETILEVSNEYHIGWYAWSWGPGNAGGGDSLCAAMDMTEDGTYQTLKPGWATEVVATSPYGIQATSVRPGSIMIGR